MNSRKFKSAAIDIRERFEDIIGVTLYEGRPIERITFWVSAQSKNYIQTKPIHESMRNIRGSKAESLKQKYNLPTGGGFYSIDCIENYELIRELSSFGADLIVLSPQHIADKVCDIAQRIVDTYKSISMRT